MARPLRASCIIAETASDGMLAMVAALIKPQARRLSGRIYVSAPAPFAQAAGPQELPTPHSGQAFATPTLWVPDPKKECWCSVTKAADQCTSYADRCTKLTGGLHELCRPLHEADRRAARAMPTVAQS